MRFVAVGRTILAGVACGGPCFPRDEEGPLPVPMEYRRASAEFEALLAETADAAGLATRNQAYTMVEGVLTAFRRRLTAEEGIAFVQVLPPMLRALFVTGWNPDEARPATWDHAALTREVQALREHHNFAPDTAIADVAGVIRRHVEEDAWARMLERMPAEARAFWEGAS